jgi:hypothetical protein
MLRTTSVLIRSTDNYKTLLRRIVLVPYTSTSLQTLATETRLVEEKSFVGGAGSEQSTISDIQTIYTNKKYITDS